MPDMSGYAVCRALKANPATENIPVIFISGKSTVGDEAAGFEVGAVDYIVKPVSPPIVLARVRTHLSLVRASHLEKSHHDAIHMLGEAGHYNDNDTGVHIWRMAAYAGALAQAVGLAAELCQQIELAAPMHDTGKIGISQRHPAKARQAGRCRMGGDEETPAYRPRHPGQKQRAAVCAGG
jgi:putative two-component system response regulator